MIISIGVISNCDIVDEVIAVEIKIIDLRFLIVKVSLKSFKSFRLLEKLHHRVEVEIVSGQSQVFIRIILSYSCGPEGDQGCEY